MDVNSPLPSRAHGWQILILAIALTALFVTTIILMATEVAIWWILLATCFWIPIQCIGIAALTYLSHTPGRSR